MADFHEGALWSVPKCRALRATEPVGLRVPGLLESISPACQARTQEHCDEAYPLSQQTFRVSFGALLLACSSEPESLLCFLFSDALGPYVALLPWQVRGLRRDISGIREINLLQPLLRGLAPMRMNHVRASTHAS